MNINRIVVVYSIVKSEDVKDSNLSRIIFYVCCPSCVHQGFSRARKMELCFESVQCSSQIPDIEMEIGWSLRDTPCWEEYALLDLLPTEEKKKLWQTYYERPNDVVSGDLEYSANVFRPPETLKHRCDNSISLTEYKIVMQNNSMQVIKQMPPSEASKTNEGQTSINTNKAAGANSPHPVFTVPADGVYLLVVKMVPVGQGLENSFSADIKVQMKSEHGYLSAADYPLLTFYGGNCILYVIYGLAWLAFAFCHWRDLLRIQFWVAAVILLGMVEMAVFYAEYQSINSTGVSVTGAVLVAEVISCAKRTLARMLVVIVSIGFGVTKPRLGTTLHQIVVVGFLYFSLASTESALRILHPVNGPSNRALMAGVPLSVLDAGICWWIFHSLLTTTRTLRLRRNLVKLALYRHFTNTLIFAVISSIAFMIWSIRYLKTTSCLRDWKEIWVDEAFWHMLFSIILLVIIILFRPSNNNQRYAFSPLIDNADDDEDDEEDLVVNQAFGSNMKLRPNKGKPEKPNKYRNQTIEDELKWVEEHIPADLEKGDLPALDSEEELVNTKFELSKMQ
ncbi:Transmembrane protein [Orchesella cincta]|uniref:Transmembrane protein n=1 Tax=Orchesella cincta TaxID=48709 RepID=A0A1D2NGF3_ORCCI|nr:Transmembrane protein [Orchesella cincta]